MDISTTGVHRLLVASLGDSATLETFAQLQVAPALLRPVADTVSRAELAQALNMLLFRDLLLRVPDAVDYVADCVKAGGKVVFDHGALRTVAWASGALPPGEAAITRVLRPLGYRHAETYPLPRLKMTGRSWRHVDAPEDIAQFFVSELHPERFSAPFQVAVGRVLEGSVDPLTAGDQALLEQLARDHALPWHAALKLLPALQRCFARQHPLFTQDDYRTLLAESAEMAWIATEGNAFNHATDRVADIDAVALSQRVLGRPIKDTIETSGSGRVRQTAFRAAQVRRLFLHEGQVVTQTVPGSFYEFIQRAPLVEGTLDLAFDAGNATGIFKMTAAA
ncbi:DUF1338 domain-containing protein [Pelomonas sp. KK5]|uniref:DUF1338 domain-containing protein n=1 Tax=Pelomonas sp. KK5 TaxID=1855730 RepID=UPI0009FB9220|nr:DUF1338 domain-containing protein [Pelomonas sp. KK5]